MEPTQRREIALHIENAREMLKVAQLLLDNDFYTSAVNRAYYAVFYAANALLITKKLSSSKHSGVISLFRQYFVKTGLIDPEYSKIYGRMLEGRREGDYELQASWTREEVQTHLGDATRFVMEMERWLKQKGWL